MDDGVFNHFIHAGAAARYAAARPYFHPMVVERIVRRAGHGRFARALDVACGTGQSAKALAAVCDSVDAIDISADMLAHADQNARIHYQQASAETLPFPDDHFDLLTVGLAFHWFDQSAFLRKAHRVLKPEAWLVIYTNGFNGETAENADFHSWAWEVYPQRFPAPPRRGLGVRAELVGPFGFELTGEEPFQNPILMTGEELTGYLLTQTNVIAAVESGTVSIADAAAWIDAGVRPFFGGGRRTMKFSGKIWYLKRSGKPLTACGQK